MKKRRRLLEEKWREFASQVIPANASVKGRRHARVLFFAGASALDGLLSMIADSIADEEIADDDCRTLFGDLQRELHDFHRHAAAMPKETPDLEKEVVQ